MAKRLTIRGVPNEVGRRLERLSQAREQSVTTVSRRHAALERIQPLLDHPSVHLGGPVPPETSFMSADKAKKEPSRILEAVHETARDLHAAGVISKRRMKEYDSLCNLSKLLAPFLRPGGE